MRAMAVAIRFITQLKSDKRSILLLLIAPLFVMFLLKTVLTSTNPNNFNQIAPLIIGFIIFFFTFIFAGISFIREKITGTLERMIATPIRRYEIVMGYFIGYGFFIIIQTVVLTIFCKYILDINLSSHSMVMIIIYLLLAFQSLGLGLALSAFAKNEFQLFQFIPIVIVPQILFSGLFDITNASLWVTMLSKIFPLTYGADAIKKLTVEGKDISYIIADMGIIIIFLMIFLLLNAVVLKKYRAK